ncbi:MAG: sigma-70 family RNA polymerase sigma factor [Solirubrobacteraceae bacterium]|jgi:RNA polymerase sigma-70 factor (ECF subfamily)|nr:sigma-70 family RNA polymerase sigma factor [Solirubrobacteraceae bacterium]
MTTESLAPPLPLAPSLALGARRDAVATPARPQRREPDRAEIRLARRLRSGDPDALSELYTRYGATTFGFLVRALGDRSAAEDVQQQVFTEVWRRSSEYDPQRAGLLTWTMTIARSRAIDHLRKRVPEPRDPEAAGRAVEARQDTAVEGDALVDSWRMTHYLSQLPEEERTLLRMRFYDELSQTEIAERTGIALGTIKARMVRGLRRMRELIEAEEGVLA